ncbi:MAG: hypothetical protein IPK69_11930 [Phycisphaerales bacterium]|nr:MAG: hypothetical protein IPK69_11930 [Phycisphaerales bacterium]
MRIKFRTSISGLNYSHMPGEDVDWPDDKEAKRFIDAGYAELVEPTKAAAKAAAKDDRKVEHADGAGTGKRSGKTKEETTLKR